MEYFIVGIGSILYATLVARRIETAVIVLPAFAPLYLVRFSFGSLPMTMLEMLLIILACGAILRSRKTLLASLVPRSATEQALLISIAAFALSASISVAVSPDTRAALGVFKAYFIEPIAYFWIAVSILPSIQSARRIVIGLACMAAFIGATALVQAFTGIGIPDPWFVERRATGFFPYPNAVGLFIAPLLPLIAVLYWGGKKWQQCAVGVALMVGFGGIIAAQSMGALAGLMAALAVWGFFWSKRSRQKTIAVIAALSIAVVVVLPLRHAVINEVGFRTWSGMVRTVMWSETRDMLFDHWLTGAGLAGYQHVIKDYHGADYLEIFLYPHSMVLNVWSELGLYGLISWLALLIILFTMIISVLRKERVMRDERMRALGFGCIAALIVILIHGLVDVPYFKNDLSFLFWTQAAIIFMFYRYAHARN